MADALFWATILLIVGLGLIVLELFVPSGGVLSVMAVLAVVAAVVVAFSGGVVPGTIMLVSVLILIPLIIAAAIKWWPHTPIGRLIVLHIPESEDEVLPDTPAYRELKSLVGCRGVAKTKMLPSGAVVIDGRTYDAVSDGTAIDPGQPIRVKAVRTNRIIVALDSRVIPEIPGEDNILAKPAEDFGIESLEEPSA